MSSIVEDFVHIASRLTEIEGEKRPLAAGLVTTTDDVEWLWHVDPLTLEVTTSILIGEEG